MAVESLGTNLDEKDLRSNLLNLEREIKNGDQSESHLGTEYHNPVGDRVRGGMTDATESSSDNDMDVSEKRSMSFLEIKNIIKSDYEGYLSDSDFNTINKRLESKADEVLKCWERYKELNEPKPKFLPFLLGNLGYNSCDDKNDYLAVVDFSMGGEDNRLYLINMKSNKVEINTTCMQGQGKNGVQTFSNKEGTWQSSLGLAQVPVSEKEGNPRNYHRERGHKDRNLLLRGAEPGFNDNILKRYIYIHTGEASKGCFTLPQNEIGHEVIDKMAYGGVIESFYPYPKYLKETNILS